MNVDRLKEVLFYNLDTGVFVWIKSYNNQHLGKEVGSFDKDGYRMIKVDKKLYRAHRLAWFYAYGEWPIGPLDHIDGRRDNNAISNLREVTFAGNSQNQRAAHADSTHGMLGVDKLSHRNLFRARIQCEGRRVTLGYFKTPEEAHNAYLLSKREAHKTCTI